MTELNVSVRSRETSGAAPDRLWAYTRNLGAENASAAAAMLLQRAGLHGTCVRVREGAYIRFLYVFVRFHYKTGHNFRSSAWIGTVRLALESL
jgi:hypothetical protein